MADLLRPPTVEELVVTVAFYGMTNIPADLLDCLHEIAADLAEDDGLPRARPELPSMRLAS